MLIYAAVQSGQYRVARAWAAKIRSHQQELHTAAFGDGSSSWTHLPLVYVRLVAACTCISFQGPGHTFISSQRLRSCTVKCVSEAENSASRRQPWLEVLHVRCIRYAADLLHRRRLGTGSRCWQSRRRRRQPGTTARRRGTTAWPQRCALFNWVGLLLGFRMLMGSFTLLSHLAAWRRTRSAACAADPICCLSSHDGTKAQPVR